MPITHAEAQAMWLSTKDAAQRLGVSVPRIRQMVYTNQIRPFRLTHSWLFLSTDIDRMIDLRRERQSKKEERKRLRDERKAQKEREGS